MDFIDGRVDRLRGHLEVLGPLAKARDLLRAVRVINMYGATFLIKYVDVSGSLIDGNCLVSKGVKCCPPEKFPPRSVSNQAGWDVEFFVVEFVLAGDARERKDGGKVGSALCLRGRQGAHGPQLTPAL